MLDVEQGHSDVGGVVAEHEVPELLRSADVEYLDMPLQGSQQRQEELESAAAHRGCQRSAVAVVGKTPDE